MAHLWIQASAGPGQGWAAVPLAGWAYRFMATAPYVRRAATGSDSAGGEMLVRIVRDSVEHWFLLVPPQGRLWVNGQPASLGVRALADRDEIRLRHGQRLYFSIERLPQIAPFPGAEREVPCGRCRKPIKEGTSAVLCPGCGTWCHQTEELPCWRYKDSSHCPVCNQSNGVEVDYRWSPVGL